MSAAAPSPPTCIGGFPQSNSTAEGDGRVDVELVDETCVAETNEPWSDHREGERRVLGWWGDNGCP